MPAMRFRLRTLLVVLALAPPLLAGLWFNRQLFIPILAFCPYFAFLIWQLRSKKCKD
jgi:hypothetical protein